MNRINFLSIITVIIVVVMIIGSISYAEEASEDEKGKRLAKAEGFTPDRYAILNINNIWAWEREDGRSNHSPLGDNGVYFPRNTSYVIYSDGFVWGSKCYFDAAHTIPAPFDQPIRVGGATYGSGSREGWIEGFGETAVPASGDDPFARIYRIRRDWAVMNDNDLIEDAADCNEILFAEVTDDQVQVILDDYRWCWENWPVHLGAPFIDRNGNGVYDPPPRFIYPDELVEGGYDEPGVAGMNPDSPADQVIWAVWNDLYRSLRFGSEPTGLEIQSTVWGYDRKDALGNIYFRRIKFINKGGVEIDESRNMGAFYLDSMYVCQWSDPDVGSAGDDLVGCDILLDMGFAYNGNDVDIRYRDYGLPPPSVGYDILQGPAIASPGDVAVFDMRYRQNYKNLGMTGFAYFGPSSPYADPAPGYHDTIRWYKMLRGYSGVRDGDVYHVHPPGVTPGPFPLAGDPVTGTVHIDGQGEDWSLTPGDRRILCNTGPFRMAPGDTQEIVVALICGLGADRLSSISVMKYNDRFAQAAYDMLFAVADAPKTPNVKIAELDSKVILEWGSDLTRVAETEGKVDGAGGYAFEGYNVYQLPKDRSGIEEAKRIATYDLITDPAVVLDEQFDPAVGQYLMTPVQYGSNSGIQREFVFDRDYVRGIDQINNGTDYYLAVTAYSVTTVPRFLPRSIESPLHVIKVVPQLSWLGEVMGSDYGQTIDGINHIMGSGDATITPIVIDPFVVVPAIYTVSWDPDSTWKVSKGDMTLIDEQTSYSGDENYPIVDGIKVKVEDVNFGAPLDFSDVSVNPSAAAADYYNISSFYTNGWSSSATALECRGTGTTDVTLLQSDIELRFTGEYDDDGVTVKDGTGSIATFIGAGNYDLGDHPMNPIPGSMDPFPIRIPFEAWDIERNMQINALIYDQNQSLSDDPFYSFNPNSRMVVFLNALAYKETAVTEEEEVNNTWNLVFRTTEWLTGDVVRIKYANPIIPGSDAFTYSTEGLEKTIDEAQKKNDVHRIGVFPNPYYAFNPLEPHRFEKFVTFNNLPPKATIRIFNLAGHLVKKIEKNDDTKFARWDLLNQNFLLVASGIYIAHINMPDEGLVKTLKLVIVMEAEFLDVY